MNCYIDLETYSATPLDRGTYAYAEDAEVMIVCYAFDNGPVHCWDRTRDKHMPYDLAEYLATYDIAGDTFTAHNSMFDRNVLRLGDMKTTILIPAWRDTMVKALVHGLPAGLDALCGVLRVGERLRKKDGRKYIHLFCKPQKDGSRATRHTHPKEWAEFLEYAKADIPSMREVDRLMPSWNYNGAELALWHLDQEINDRGLLIDTDLCKAAIRTTAFEKVEHAARTAEITAHEVASATQRDALLEYILIEQGVMLPDMQADTLQRRLDDPDLPEAVRELIAIRLEVSSTSVSKYKTLLQGIDSRGRMCGTLQFGGAGRTSRWAGRKFQPQNLTRVPKYVAKEYDTAIEIIKAGGASLVYDKPIEVCGSVVRGAIVAPPGKKLCIADLSNIEGRGAAWLCGEDWMLDAFRAADAGDGPDLYKVSYGAAFNVPPETVEDGSTERQIGKVMELMLQYQGGVGAFLTGAATYGIDLVAMADVAWDTIPEGVRLEAEEFMVWQREKNRSTYGLPDKVFIVCESIKRLWRGRRLATVEMWGALETAVRDAILNPGVTFTVRKLKVRRDGNWMRIGLPSGRVVPYPNPQLDKDGKITYMGLNQYSKKWSRIGTYGGKLLENVTQAVSRDVMAAAMPAADAAGYEIVLTVHDEIVAETPDTPEFSGAKLGEIMSVVPAWAAGLPLAAGGYDTYRYRKG